MMQTQKNRGWGIGFREKYPKDLQRMGAATLGCLWASGGLIGCTQAFRQSSLEQQVQTFKETTDQLAALARETEAIFYAELDYDGREQEVYAKQSLGVGLPIRIRMGVMGQGGKGAASAGALKWPEGATGVIVGDPACRSGLRNADDAAISSAAPGSGEPAADQPTAGRHGQ